MTRLALLNNVDHRDLMIETGHHARFGDAVNQTRVFPAEYEELQREYAILLRRDENGDLYATVLLGLDPDENLFLDGERWDARYVPATRARGAFSIGLASDGEPMVHVDLDHPRVGQEGVPVFREQGGNGPLLDHISDMLQRIYAGLNTERAVFDALSDADLLVPATLQLDLDEGRRYTIPDCLTVDAQRIADLPDDALARLHRQDFLRPAIWIASSLGNIRQLIDRKLRRDDRG